MKMSGGVEWALHCCVVLSAADEPVPAARLAAFHDVSGTYLAKALQALSRAGLIHATQGRSGGYVLSRPAQEISVLHVVEAVDGATPAFVCTEIRQRGPLATPPEACVKPCGIRRVMDAADAAWRGSLSAVSVADLATGMDEDYGVGALDPVRAWLRDPVVAEA